MIKLIQVVVWRSQSQISRSPVTQTGSSKELTLGVCHSEPASGSQHRRRQWKYQSSAGCSQTQSRERAGRCAPEVAGWGSRQSSEPHDEQTL